jgi:hypothetical protein
MALRRDICSTFSVLEYEAVKMGSKIAARYRASIGDVKDEAMMFEGCGSFVGWFARDLMATISIMNREELCG